MANGDAAAALGWPTVAGTDDRRNGYDEINLTRDLVANSLRAFYPENYGADPTGVTESRAAIQAAMAAASAAGGGTVVIGGTYKIATSLTPLSNVTLEGRGWGRSIIKPTSTFLGGADGSVLQAGGSTGSPITNFWVRDIKFDLSDVPATQQAKAIFVTFMRNFRFQNNWVLNSTATGIGADFLDKSIISGNRVEGCGRYAEGLETSRLGCSGIGIGTGAWGDEATLVEGNFVIDAVRYGIFVEYQGVSTYMTTGVKIVNNHITGAYWGIGDCGVAWAHIIGNSVENSTQDGIVIAPRNGDTNAYGDMVANNTVRGSGRHGMFIDLTVATGTTEPDAGKFMIAHNRFLTSTSVGLKISTSAQLVGVQIHGNRIALNGSYGLELAGGGLADSDVSSNRMIDNGSAGIRIVGDLLRVKIAGNRSGDSRSSGRTQTHGLDLDAGNTITSCQIENNALDNNTVAGLNLVGTVTACRITSNAGDARLEWATATLLNSWAIVTGLPAKYRMTDDGKHVEFAGRIQTGAASTVAFQLPAGFRPVTAKTLTMYSFGNGGGRGIEIGTGGDVTVLSGVTQPISLDGLVFAIDV